jgi:hypothetical protein
MADPLSNTKSKEQESVAYHEAGHIVVATVLEFHIEDREKSMVVCESGLGKSFYKPTLIPCDDPGSTRRRIIALHAGLIAQRQFLPTCSDRYGDGDGQEISNLLEDMYGSPTEKANQLRTETHRECRDIVEIKLHSRAIEALATELWKKPWTESANTTDPCGPAREKWLGAKEIVEILQGIGLSARLCKSGIIRD